MRSACSSSSLSTNLHFLTPTLSRHSPLSSLAASGRTDVYSIFPPVDDSAISIFASLRRWWAQTEPPDSSSVSPLFPQPPRTSGVQQPELASAIFHLHLLPFIHAARQSSKCRCPETVSHLHFKIKSKTEDIFLESRRGKIAICKFFSSNLQTEDCKTSPPLSNQNAPFSQLVMWPCASHPAEYKCKSISVKTFRVLERFFVFIAMFRFCPILVVKKRYTTSTTSLALCC